MFRGTRSSRFFRGKGRCADPSDMGRTMEIFGIEKPTLLNPPNSIPAAQSTIKLGLTSPVPAPAEPSSSKRGRTSSPDKIPTAPNKRGLIRIVSDKELNNSQVSGAPLTSNHDPSISFAEGTSRAIGADITAGGSSVPKIPSLTVNPGKNVSAPATHGSQTYVPPMTPTPVGSLKELLEPLLKVDAKVVV